jgi:hypothetical protein
MIKIIQIKTDNFKMKIQLEKLIHPFNHNNKILCKQNYLIQQIK